MNRLLRKTLIFLAICCRLPSLLLVRMGKRTAYMLILVALQAHMQKGQRPLLQRQEVVNLPHPTIRNKKRNDNLLACLRLLRFRHMGRPETSFERIISRGTSILWLLSFWYA